MLVVDDKFVFEFQATAFVIINIDFPSKLYKVRSCLYKPFSQNWEEIKIEEESEEGKKVESVIRVPAQVI